MESIPTSDNAALADLLFAVRKRSRAGKHLFAVARCEKVFEEKDGERHERIDIVVQRLQSPKSVRISICFWDDRWLWIDAREASPQGGWRFEWTDQGRLSGERGGRDVVEALERSYAALLDGTFDADALTEIWRSLLSKGPSAV